MRAISSRPISWLLLVAALVPILLAVAVQKKHWINIPIWDEWDTPGLALLHYSQHTLTWADLFAQHNESRKVIPRLIHIAIASVAGWDVRQGMALTLICACVASAFGLLYLRRTAAPTSHAIFAWLVVNLLLFAPSQYENFLSGFSFEILIPFLCLFTCCSINLSNWRLSVKTLCNSFLALLATYTFAHGMLLWAFVIPIPTRDKRPRNTFSLVLSYTLYAAVGIFSVAFYFVGYKRPEIAPPLPGLTDLPQLFEFIIVWLGAVLRSPLLNPRLSGLFFIATTTVVLILTVRQLRATKDSCRNYYPWLLLLALALTSGVLTAIGRVTIGVDAVFNTSFNGFSGMRYNITAVFAYIAVIGLVSNLYHDRIRANVVSRRHFLIGLSSCCLLFALAWMEMFLNESTRVKQFQANRRRARTAVIWSNALPQNPEMVLAYPYPDLFWKRVEEMRAAGLIQFPKVSEPLTEAIASAPVNSTRQSGHLDLCEPLPPAYSRFAGWARDPVKRAAADYVVLGWEDAAAKSFHPFTAIPTGIVRPDVAQTYGAPSLKAGFDQDIETSRLPAEAVTIKAWAIDWEAQQAFPVDGASIVIRAN
jgi:hypothetical protein